MTLTKKPSPRDDVDYNPNGGRRRHRTRQDEQRGNNNNNNDDDGYSSYNDDTDSAYSYRDHNDNRSSRHKDFRRGRSPQARGCRYSALHDNDNDDDLERWKQRILAAVDAVAVEAFRLRREPGPWMGAKGRRLATVALTAAAADGFLAKKDTSGARGGGRTQRIESALVGLLVNRLINGPRRTLRRET